MKHPNLSKWLLSLMLLASATIHAQIVNIPDANFKAALLADPNVNTNSDSEIQTSEASAARMVFVISKNISSLSGIEAFVNLEYLDCHWNNLTSLSVQSNLKLKQLTCYGNQIRTLSLPSSGSLFGVECQTNQIEYLTIPPSTTLAYLDCSANNLYTLVAQNLPALHTLKIDNNNRYLYHLDLSGDTTLSVLNASMHAITFLDVQGCTNLTELRCSSNRLSSIDLSTNTKLKILECNNNLLTNLNLSPCPNLESVSCDFNSLTTLDMRSLINLKSLSCKNNLITSLDLSLNVLLEYLTCSYNQLTQLDLSNNVLLQYINCSNNEITQLNFLTQNALKSIYCSYNQLTELVQNSPVLENLSVGNNQITSLDLSGNSGLKSLNCINNKLSSLDLRNGSNSLITLSYNMYLNNNPNLLCVSVDNPAWSTANWTNKDPQTQFSSNCACGQITIGVDSLSHVTCTNQGYVKAFASGPNGPFQYEWLNSPLAIDSILVADTAGFYTLKVTDHNLCESFKKIVMDAPKVLTGHELNTQLSAPTFRPGRTTSVELMARNDGCVAQNAQIKLIYHGPLSFESSGIPPTTHTGDTLTWDLGNMNYSIDDFLSSLVFRTDTLAQMGDDICFDLEITPISGDADSTNNRKTFCFNVVNSYDPNDKQVFPQGVCADNYTLNTETLTYTLRFQNTGNAPAIDVYLLDSLSADLDLNSLNVVSASHDGLITEIIGQRTLKFNFPNINLADSLSDEAGSKGFVIFEISPFSGLPEGTVIENEVGIYFDFNPPVITNKTRNTLVSALPILSSTINETVCSTYTAADGQVYTTSGVYTAILPNASGCDSTITINLTVNQPTNSTINETVCSTYTAPDGQVYTSSGVYSAILPNALGCDSTITINLTVNQPASSSISVQSCGAYTSPDGKEYLFSGTYQAILPGASGCDSTITIHLTILNATSAYREITSCGTYTAPDGQQYSQSGTYEAHLTNAAGCDSLLVFTLHLNEVHINFTTNYDPVVDVVPAQAQITWYNCETDLPIATGNACNCELHWWMKLRAEARLGTCVDSTSCQYFYLEGVDELSDEALVLYPNPGAGPLTVQTKYWEPSFQIRISDNLGRLIEEFPMTSPTMVIELQKAAGSYLIQLVHQEQVRASRKVLRL